MKISVIIPVYNRQDTAIRAIRSVLMQKVQEMELIIVDDCSEPAFICPADLIDDYRVVVLRHAKNKGAGAARNTGVQQARGEYVAFLDSDDIWRPGKLDAQLSYAAEREADLGDKLTAYVCGFRLKSAVTGQDRILQPISARSQDDFVSGCWFCPGSTLLLPRHVFEKVGLYDEQLARLEDFDWFIRFGQAGGTLYSVDGIFVDIEAAARPKPEMIKSSGQYLLDKYGGGGNQDLKLHDIAYRYLKAYMALEQAAVHVAHGERLTAGLNLARSVMLKPRLSLHLKDWWGRAL